MYVVIALNFFVNIMFEVI